MQHFLETSGAPHCRSGVQLSPSQAEHLHDNDVTLDTVKAAMSTSCHWHHAYCALRCNRPCQGQLNSYSGSAALLCVPLQLLGARPSWAAIGMQNRLPNMQAVCPVVRCNMIIAAHLGWEPGQVSGRASWQSLTGLCFSMASVPRVCRRCEVPTGKHAVCLVGTDVLQTLHGLALPAASQELQLYVPVTAPSRQACPPSSNWQHLPYSIRPAASGLGSPVKATCCSVALRVTRAVPGLNGPGNPRICAINGCKAAPLLLRACQTPNSGTVRTRPEGPGAGSASTFWRSGQHAQGRQLAGTGQHCKGVACAPPGALSRKSW